MTTNTNTISFFNTDVINLFNYLLDKYIDKTNQESCIFNSNIFFKVLSIAYSGTNNETKNKLDTMKFNDMLLTNPPDNHKSTIFIKKNIIVINIFF